MSHGRRWRAVSLARYTALGAFRRPLRQTVRSPSFLVGFRVRVGDSMKRVLDPCLAALPQHEAEDVLAFDRSTLLDIAQHRCLIRRLAVREQIVIAAEEGFIGSMAC